jgi:nucleoporin GLE1
MHLKEALEGKVPSPHVDVSLYVLDNREPVDGAMHNGPTMPALFIYLMNICAKAIISQFVNECAANPKAADPIGVSTAQIFSAPEFHWRGKSLIDILMAKFRVACPVLFGVTKGSEKTHGGRANLGWRKIDDSYVTEQVHNDRMTGLGAGFAAISLRDFSKVKKTNPFPPVNYWKAIAFIINTPAGETTNTHYVVLRSMIQSYEQRFLNFFGRAALAALQLALVEFPKKAPANASAAGSLAALAEVLRNNGLVLA